MSTPRQKHIPHGFSLLFGENELSTVNSAFLRIEGTLYQQEGEPHLNAAGRYAFAATATDDGTKAEWCDYASLAELMAALKLSQDKVAHLDKRLMALLNRPI